VIENHERESSTSHKQRARTLVSDKMVTHRGNEGDKSARGKIWEERDRDGENEVGAAAIRRLRRKERVIPGKRGNVRPYGLVGFAEGRDSMVDYLGTMAHGMEG
jgi:hypothetical protein